MKSMLYELSSLQKVGTGAIEKVPDLKKVICTKWVFDLIHDSKGNVIRQKVGMVTKEFWQIAGTDYTEVVSLVWK